MRLCAITNVYNEAFNLPIWLRYYGAQVGIANCVVVDHGSDDGSTDDLGGAERIGHPRSALDDVYRADFIADLVADRLRSYDAVIYTDCDEMLVADPARHAGLADLANAMDAPAMTAIGLNLAQRISREVQIDPTRPILAQRRFATFSVAMCKTLLVRTPVRWTPGFHHATVPPSFGDLYLFHLRWVDQAQARLRMAITRSIDRVHPGHGAHQRVDDGSIDRRYAKLARATIDTTFDFTAEAGALCAGVTRAADGIWHFPSDVRRAGLIRVPPRFRRSGL